MRERLKNKRNIVNDNGERGVKERKQRKMDGKETEKEGRKIIGKRGEGEKNRERGVKDSGSERSKKKEKEGNRK